MVGLGCGVWGLSMCPPAGARGDYGRQSGGEVPVLMGLAAPMRPTTSATCAAALVVREVLDHREGGERDHDAANEHVRDLLPLGGLLCDAKTFGWGPGRGLGVWARKNRAAGHARIASSIECPDICRTPVGARMERRRKAIMMGSELVQGQQVAGAISPPPKKTHTHTHPTGNATR